MVDKISLNVKIVGLNIEHNFLLPSEMSVKNATDLIVQALREEYPGLKDAVLNGHMLMQASSGKILPQLFSFKQLEIVQGDKIILI